MMNRKLLESYQSNKRLIERNKKKIEEERYRDIPVVMGKVTGSSHDFPYVEQRFTVQMDEPVEADRSTRRISSWMQEIANAELDTAAVEQFIAGIDNARDREVFTYRYIDGLKTVDVGRRMCYTKGRISQIISKYVKD